MGVAWTWWHRWQCGGTEGSGSGWCDHEGAGGEDRQPETDRELEAGLGRRSKARDGRGVRRKAGEGGRCAGAKRKRAVLRRREGSAVKSAAASLGVQQREGSSVWQQADPYRRRLRGGVRLGWTAGEAVGPSRVPLSTGGSRGRGAEQ